MSSNLSKRNVPRPPEAKPLPEVDEKTARTRLAEKYARKLGAEAPPAGEPQHLMEWALDEIDEVSNTVRDPRSPEAEHEMERVVREFKERLKK